MLVVMPGDDVDDGYDDDSDVSVGENDEAYGYCNIDECCR